MNKSINTRKLVMAALFAALTCVATMIIKVPTLATNGYVNIGDTIVLLSAWLVGGVYGALAAGIGSALADMLSQYAAYVPGTFVIKFLMAFVAYLIFKAMQKSNINKVVAYVVSGIVAEFIMVVCYFLYESIFLGYGLAAAPSVISNLVQGATCLALGYVAVLVLESTKAVKMINKYI